MDIEKTTSFIKFRYAAKSPMESKLFKTDKERKNARSPKKEINFIQTLSSFLHPFQRQRTKWRQ